MNKKSLIYCFGLNLFFGLLIIGSSSPVAAQKNKKPERKKFGWSLKKTENRKKSENQKESENRKESEKKFKKESKPVQQNGEIDDEETVKIDTDLILTDILVLNKNGEAVFGLKESDFIVAEDDAPQKIEVFSSPSAEKQAYPRHFVFIIDHYPSLVGHMRNNIDAARSFVDKLAPQDKMAIVTDDVKLLQDFTDDKARLKNKLEWVYKDFMRRVGRAGGWGLTYTALHTVLNEMFETEGVRPIIVLQSNGSELYSLKGGKDDASLSKFGLHYGFFNFTYQDLLTKIIEKRATVYSIIMGRRFVGLPDEEKIKNLVLMQIDHQYDWEPVKLESIVPLEKATDHLFIRRIMRDALDFQSALVKVAETSGGTAKFLQTPEDAQTVYADIFADADGRYLIGYYSTNQDRGQKIRKVKIEVRERPEYEVRGRQTYFAR